MVVKLFSREAEALFERGVKQFYLVPSLDPPLAGGHAVCSKIFVWKKDVRAAAVALAVSMYVIFIFS